MWLEDLPHLAADEPGWPRAKKTITIMIGFFSVKLEISAAAYSSRRVLVRSCGRIILGGKKFWTVSKDPQG